MVTAVYGMVVFVVVNATRWPAFPIKLIRAFWPGVVSVNEKGAPPGATCPLTSSGTSVSVTVALPVDASYGSITRVYVPVTGATFVSVKYEKSGYTPPAYIETPSGRRTSKWNEPFI